MFLVLTESKPVPAYARYSVDDFVHQDPSRIVAKLHSGYANDGFLSQYTQQTKAWDRILPLLQSELRQLAEDHPDAKKWGILLEYPLYRLRKRIDAVLLSNSSIFVIETKVGASSFQSADARQVEEYALDLRDFHAGSKGHPLVPILWCTDASPQQVEAIASLDWVSQVCRVGASDLRNVLKAFATLGAASTIEAENWDNAPYRPVPTIIQAATTIFAGHDVRAIARADASNLAICAQRIVEIIADAKRTSRKAAIFLTGVPGAGKTLAGLQVVHDAVSHGTEKRGDIVYLSGNSPLVFVLREALARDMVERGRANNGHSTVGEARRLVRTRIQHISDFLKQYLTGTQPAQPYEHAIVFDEAQRAWDAAQGAKKFDRPMSEPSLILEIMGRHKDWCACVCLVGGGQEINTGEEGIKGWGDALRSLDAGEHERWTVYGPPDVFEGGASTGGLSIGELPVTICSLRESELRLSVPLRSYRCPAVCEWVSAVLDGDLGAAKGISTSFADYPVVLTRSLDVAKVWLRDKSRGERRCGLLASSGARRLRADGLGVLLGAGDGDAIAHWYLNNREDIRSSYCLEVPANEYACQGLEIDHSAICWGGDLLFEPEQSAWKCRELSGPRWNEVHTDAGKRHIVNTYRVLMTRAREGFVIWVPKGSSEDRTREPYELDSTAAFLIAAGAVSLDGK